jgi:serpin B
VTIMQAPRDLLTNRVPRPASLAVPLVGALLLVACDGGPVAAGSVERSQPEPAAVAPIGRATNAFAVDLYQELTETSGGNLVFSPYSAAIALSMARVGAAGATAEQMDAVLHAELTDDLSAGFNALDQALNRRAGKRKRADGTAARIELDTGNAIWGDAHLQFHGAFLDTLAAQYGTGVRLVDYRQDPEDARWQINRWVSEQTRQRIPQIVPAGVINTLTGLVLTNAIYLKAPWEAPFAERGTREAPFHRLDGSTVSAPLMRLSEWLAYRRGEGWQAVELPYAGRELSMVVVVPDAGGFEAFESGLEGTLLDGLVEGLRGSQVNLAMPRFEFRMQAALSEALKRLGMPIAFTEGADFSLMTGQEPLRLTEVVHEAFIAVDEEGTEAAAATAVVVGITSAPAEPVNLTIDRPFLFYIRDVETGVVLFMGRVLDPTA